MRCSTSTRREAGASRPHARGHGSAGCFLLEGGGWARDSCCLHRWGCVRAFDAPALWRRPKRERETELEASTALWVYLVSDRVSRLVVTLEGSGTHLSVWARAETERDTPGPPGGASGATLRKEIAILNAERLLSFRLVWDFAKLENDFSFYSLQINNNVKAKAYNPRLGLRFTAIQPSRETP